MSLTASQPMPRPRRIAWVLMLAGILVMASPVVGLHALPLFGLSIASAPVIIGAITLLLLVGGLLVLAIGIGFAVAGRPGWLIGIAAALLVVAVGPWGTVVVMHLLGLTDPHPDAIIHNLLMAIAVPAGLVMLAWGLVSLVRRRGTRAA